MMRSSWTFGLMVLLVLSCSRLATADEGSLDTTRVRQPEKPTKTFGQIVADIPGEILKLPVRTIRLVALGATRKPVSHVTSLIKLSGPVRRYVPVAGYSSNAGVKFGVGLRKITKKFWDDRLDFKWYYSTNDYQSYQFRFKLRQLLGERIGIDLVYRYKKRPRESFYGVGMGVPEELEANYTLESSEFRVDLPFHHTERLSVGITGGFTITNLFDGRDPDEPGNLDSIAGDSIYALKPGRLDGARYIRAGIILEWDGRNNGGQPSSGFHVLSRMVRYIGTNRSHGQGYYETKLDVRHYIDVWRKRIIAARLYVQRFDADNSNRLATPINLISRLGGTAGLRGYSSGRFIDNDLALASIEWRYPVWKVIDGFVFLDEGRVFEEITDSRVFRGWKYSAGLGFRVWNVQEVSFSSTIAFGDEGAEVYVAGGITW